MVGRDGQCGTSILFLGLKRRILRAVIFPRCITGGLPGGHRELVTDTCTKISSYPVASTSLSLLGRFALTRK